jgi:opacity protein-like surface antigen
MSTSSFWLAVVATAAIVAATTPALSADVPAESDLDVAVEDDNHWYASLQGGLIFGTDWDDESPLGDFHLDVENGWRIGGAAGYSLSPVFSLEGEIGYLREEGDASGCCDGGNISILTGMVNLIAGTALAGWLHPYVGVGAGLAHVSLNDIDLPGPVELDDSDIVFGAQGFAGMDFVLTEWFALGGRYRLLHLDEVHGSAGHDLDPDLIHSIEAVFTVGF